MASKTVTRSIIRVVRCTLSLPSFSNSLLRNYVLTSTYKSHFLRKSRITRHSSQNRIFYYFAKTSLLLTKLRKNILAFKRVTLKQKLWKVGKIDFMPVFRTKHSSTQLREKGARVRNIPWYWNKVLNFYNRQAWRGHICDVGENEGQLKLL